MVRMRLIPTAQLTKKQPAETKKQNDKKENQNEYDLDDPYISDSDFDYNAFRRGVQKTSSRARASAPPIEGATDVHED